jgi:Histidine kinase-, DNA gyrase B-, and HSP90-like ATPase
MSQSWQRSAGFVEAVYRLFSPIVIQGLPWVSRYGENLRPDVGDFMNRFRLSAKLALAVIPIGLVALLAAGFVANSFLKDSAAQNESARAATVTAEALDTLQAVWDEQAQARQLFVFFDAGASNEYAAAIEQTDAAISRLESSLSELATTTSGLSKDVAVSASEQVDAMAADLQRIRSIDSPTGADISAYTAISDALLSLMPKASSLVSDRVEARDLSTAYFLAEGGQVSLEQEQLIEEFRATAFPSSSATATSNSRNTLQATLDLLEEDFAAWGLRASQTANRSDETVLQFAEPMVVDIDTFPTQRNDDILGLSGDLAQGVTTESAANANQSEREAYLIAGVAAIVLLLALWGAYSVIRSIVRRVRSVTDAATHVTEVDLPNLVDALQNPNEDLAALSPTSIEAAGSDEVGELASSFVLLHTTLIAVAGQQMDILRRGVSEIFVTLARRNRSLVDRQLALLDELEAREEHAETLGGYYKLDHLATRMRRNAESLLVLAGSEPTRVWDDPLDVSEIIRAALGEVDEYQRVDIMALEPALVSGRAVADIAHLMSELLDNGTQYSSPTDRVRVAGLFDPEGYMLTVSDTGIGVTDAKLAELNSLLASPPVLGLALQPTLGMYVVARLAARHGVRVQLIAGSPGLTIRVLLPKELIEAARPKADQAAEPLETDPYVLANTTRFRPQLAATNGGTRSGPSYVNSDVRTPEPEFQTPVANETAAASETPVVNETAAASETAVENETAPPSRNGSENGTAVLPGSIVGKHEHPGRQKNRIEVDDGSGDGMPFAAESDSSMYSELGGLARRTPGEALRAESDGIEQFEHEPDVAPVVRQETTDDSPWWAKDLVTEDTAGVDERRNLWDDVEPAEASGPTKFAPSSATFQPSPARIVQPANEKPVVSEAGLPMRTPGVSFHETDESDVSSAASESGAMGIKSALTSYRGGRAMATSDANDDDPGDDRE